jgi:type III secretion protein R
MHMLSPTTVSLPFKLLLFVVADGWTLVVRGLMESYL